MIPRPAFASAVPARLFCVVLLAGAFAPVRVAAGPETTGQWSTFYDWPNVAIHLHLLPDGKVLSYADDDNPNYNVNGARLAGKTRAFLVDVPNGAAPGAVVEVDNLRSNMFCSGHSFVADGRLMVIGGHLGKDGWGEPRTEFFDYRAPTNWWPGPHIFLGRRYPTACVLANGDLLAISGSNDSLVLASSIPEVWSSVPNGGWRQLTGGNRTLPYYPFAILAPNGQVFVAGPQVDARMLDCNGIGSWGTARNHILNQQRDYGSAVQYADGKIMVCGGGDPPTNTSEKIDLNAGTPAWSDAGTMNFNRRQMNATILPDGTVLATGGTSGGGFNNNTGAVLAAEIWTPPAGSGAGTWAPMAAMTKPRLYHSSTVLLPDGRVLSAGSGRPKATNGWVDQYNCEIFSPPYLFKGARPTITSSPVVANNGVAFTINTPDAASITRVTMVRLSSTTHSFNQDQRFNTLSFTAGAGSLTATVPASSALAPPGFYILFILNATGVPSVGKMLHVVAPGPVAVDDTPQEGLLDFMSLRSENPSHGDARIVFALSHSEFGRIEVL